MTTTINASTSSGLVTTPDNSGAIALQSNGTTGVLINSSGQVTTPQRPGFIAYGITQYFNGSNWYAPSTYTLQYYSGGGFSATAGPGTSWQYTFPVSGLYTLNWQVMGDSANARMEVGVTLNAGNLINGDNTTIHYANTVVNCVFYAYAGDYMNWKLNTGGYYNISNTNPWLSVVLLG